MDDKNWYQDWFGSTYYHQLPVESDENEAESFIRQLSQYIGITPTSRILDTACGRGNLIKILSATSHQITGLDLSPANIEFAQRHLEQQNELPEFFIHDIRLPFRGNYYDYAFNLFTKFGYYRTRREHDDAFRTIANSLKPGGLLIIDYLNLHYAEQNIVHTEVEKAGSANYDIHRWDDESHFFKKITVTDPAIPAPIIVTEKFAKLSVGDFTDMLSFQSMQVQDVFGDYQLGHYDVLKSPRLIIVAKKKFAEESDKEKRLYSDGRKTDALT